jgi:hypothetical protein
MKHDEEKEIGELVLEIIRKPRKMQIKPISFGFWQVTLFHDTGSLHMTSERTPDLVQALGNIVDRLRKERGEPTRAQELEKMLADDSTHAAAPPVEIGPDACCGCGSKNPLIVERKLRLEFPWDGSDAWINEGTGLYENLNDDIMAERKPGEIGTCPDCGRHYTFGA